MVATLDGKPLRPPDGQQAAFAANGIAISNDGATRCYQELTGRTLYSIATAKLRDGVRDAEWARAVEKVADTHFANGL